LVRCLFHSSLEMVDVWWGPFNLIFMNTEHFVLRKCWSILTAKKWRQAFYCQTVFTNYYLVYLVDYVLSRFFYFPTHDWLSIIWSLKEDDQAPAITNLAWLWHHFHLELDWMGIEQTTFRTWALCSTARPQLSLLLDCMLRKLSEITNLYAEHHHEQQFIHSNWKTSYWRKPKVVRVLVQEWLVNQLKKFEFLSFSNNQMDKNFREESQLTNLVN